MFEKISLPPTPMADFMRRHESLLDRLANGARICQLARVLRVVARKSRKETIATIRETLAEEARLEQAEEVRGEDAAEQASASDWK
jgi:hypothetical protein